MTGILSETLLARCPAAARPALALIDANPALALREAAGELEIWADTAGGKRVKVGGCSLGTAADGGAALYLAHVFLVTRRLTEAATTLGFAPEIGPAGRRLWVLDESAGPARFAEALAALLGLEGAGGGLGGARTRLPLRPETLFGARRIAIVGADEAGQTPAGASLAALQAAGYDGRLLPVATAGGETPATVQGLPAAAPEALGAAPEIAVIAADHPTLSETLKALAGIGTRAAIVLEDTALGEGSNGSGGGLALVRELRDLADEIGLAIIGPGSGGLVHAPARLAIGPAAPHLPALPPRDGTGGAFVALVSGGAMAGQVAALAARRGMAPRSLIGLGREADTQVAEALDLLLADGEAASLPILLAIETTPAGEGAGRAMAEALERARLARRPVIALRADAPDPARTTGEDGLPADPLGMVLDQAGAVTVDSLEAALDIAAAARQGRYPSGRRIGVFGSGTQALGPLVARQAAGLSLNPEAVVAASAAEAVRSGSVEVLLGLWPAPEPDAAPALLEQLAEGAEAAWDMGRAAPLMLHAAVFAEPMQALADTAQLAVYPEPLRALETIGALTAFGRAFERPAAAAARLPHRAGLPDGPVTEAAMTRALEAIGLTLDPTAAATETSTPTVLRILPSPIWGPVLGVSGPADSAWRRLPLGQAEARGLASATGLAPAPSRGATPPASPAGDLLWRLASFAAAHATRLPAFTLEGVTESTGESGFIARALTVAAPAPKSDAVPSDDLQAEAVQSTTADEDANPGTGRHHEETAR